MNNNKLLYVLASALAIIPFYDFKRHAVIKRKFLKFYGMFHILFICSLGLYSAPVAYGYYNSYEPPRTYTQIPGQALAHTLSIFQSFFSVLRNTFWNVHNWEKLFKTYSSYNYMLMNNQYSSGKTTRITVLLATLFVAAGAIFNNALWMNVIGLDIQSKYVSLYYCMFTEHLRMIVSYTFIKNVKKNLEFLNELVKQRFKKNKQEISFMLIQMLYRKWCEIMRLLNCLQGSQIFLGLLQSSVMFLMYFDDSYSQLTHYNQVPFIIFISSGIVAVSVLVRKQCLCL